MVPAAAAAAATPFVMMSYPCTTQLQGVNVIPTFPPLRLVAALLPFPPPPFAKENEGLDRGSKIAATRLGNCLNLSLNFPLNFPVDFRQKQSLDSETSRNMACPAAAAAGYQPIRVPTAASPPATAAAKSGSIPGREGASGEGAGRQGAFHVKGVEKPSDGQGGSRVHGNPMRSTGAEEL
mmetsp:Transcript_4423/g.7898  ORF Transcript_4423/g.7898 Transcript_4423/m.7898 type:complete len:180 (+) Transcript_4423:505-1044(+)